MGAPCPSVSTTHASCSTSSRICAVRSWRHIARDAKTRGISARSYLACASKICKSSNSARSACTACVHATVPPAAPDPSPAEPGGGRCVRRPASTPFTDTRSACASQSRHSVSRSLFGCHLNGWNGSPGRWFEKYPSTGCQSHKSSGSHCSSASSRRSESKRGRSEPESLVDALCCAAIRESFVPSVDEALYTPDGSSTESTARLSNEESGVSIAQSARIKPRRSFVLASGRSHSTRWSTPTASSAASPCLAGKIEPMHRNTRSTNAPSSIRKSKGRALSGSSKAKNAPVYVPSAPRHRTKCSSFSFSASMRSFSFSFASFKSDETG